MSIIVIFFNLISISMNSYLKNFKCIIRDAWLEDIKRIKFFYFKMIQFYENLEFYRLTSKFIFYYIDFL
jgi:hypothetical protein